MTHADVLPILLELAATRFGRTPGSLRASDDFFETLGIDSVEAMSMITALEERFRIEIPDYEVQDVRTFEELAAVIARRA